MVRYWFILIFICSTTIGQIVPTTVINKKATAQQIQATVAQHYRGHVASFSENTDGDAPGFELWLCRHNLGGSVFAGALTTTLQDIYDFGRSDVGVYSAVSSYLTDYNDITTVRDGAPPTTGGYAVGDTSYKASMKPLVLMMRNTWWESRGKKEYRYTTGITDDMWISRGSTISFAEYCVQKDGVDPTYNFIAGTNSQGYAKLDVIVPEVIAAGGWYTNFMHALWYNTNYAKDYFAGVNARIGSADVFRGSYKDVVEYYWVRESVNSINVSGHTITINYSKDYPSGPYANITTPLWIEVNLNGTDLAGKQITTSHGGMIRNKGSNQYVISVPLNYANTSTSFTISETLTPAYVNLTVPVVTVVGNTITSDQPVKWTLFKKTKAQLEVDATIVERGLILSSNTYISSLLDKTTYDYYLGYINQYGVSGMVEPVSFTDPGGHTSDLASTITSAGATLVYDFDYRYNVSTGGGRVYYWGDQSSNGFVLKPTASTTALYAMADGFGDNSTTVAVTSTAPWQSLLNTLHDGSPFIAIAILKQGAAAAVNFHLQSSNQTGNPGAFFQILCNTGNLSFQAQNNAGTSLGSNNTANGTVATGRFLPVTRVYYGSGTGASNAKMYTESTLTNFTYNPVFGTGNSTRLYVGKSSSAVIDFRIKRIILVKCTGLTSGQIDALRASLFTQIKSDPEYSGLTTP